MRVLVDGREALRRRFTAEDAFAAKPAGVAVPATGRRSEVRIETEGRGRLYVSANWQWRQADSGAGGSTRGSGALRAERRYYRLRRVDAGGRIEFALEPWGGPALRGDIVAVHVRARAPEGTNAFVLEDLLPAGAEAVPRDDAYALRGKPGWWRWWYERRELRDDRTSWFPWWVPREGLDAVYLFRFTHAGKFRVAPARIEPMYEPGAMAWSEAAEWEVLP